MVLRRKLVMLKDGPCAIDSREPCQAGNRAALIGVVNVLQDYLSGVTAAASSYRFGSIEGV